MNIEKLWCPAMMRHVPVLLSPLYQQDEITWEAEQTLEGGKRE
jgi:hypothetical protein